MATKSIYFNIEDDVKSIVARLRQEPGREFVLVFPRRCYLFSDAVNLKLLKKQLDILHKSVAIMTMDERGQSAAAEAGFSLVAVQKKSFGHGMSDVAPRQVAHAETPDELVEQNSGVGSVAAVEAEESPKLTKRITKSIPKIATKDTFFADITHNRSFAGDIMQSRAAHTQKRKTMLLGGVVLAVIAVVVVMVYVLPKATVALVPETEPVNRDLEVLVSNSAKQLDVNTLALPGFGVDKIVPMEEKLEVTGKRELGSKAEGQVRIINLTGAPINLKSTTTVLTNNGREYRFTTDQNLVKAISSKLATAPEAGQAARVVAVLGGEAANLPVGTRLEITNQVFGNKPSLLYAVVDEALVGGNSRFVSIITEEDLAKAKSVLVETAVLNISAELKAQGQILAEQTYNAEVVDFSTDKPVATETTTFTARGKVHIKGIAFGAVSLTELVRARVAQVLPAGVNLQPSGKDVLTFKVRALDLVAGTMRIVVHFESKLISTIELSTIGPGLLGKSKTEAVSYLSEVEGVEKAEIVIWPKWQSSLPRLASRIKVFEQAN